MKSKLTLITTIFSLALSACGGGGGGDSKSGDSGATQGTGNGGLLGPGQLGYINERNIQRTVSAPDYPAGSQNLAAFNAVNAFRASVGLGLLAQGPKMDLMAENHANYLSQNNLAYTVDEVEGFTGYTGSNLYQRAKFVEFKEWPGASFFEANSSLNGANGIEALINTIYHRSLLLQNTPNVIGLSNSTGQLINLGYSSDPGLYSSDFLSFYPLNEQTNVPLKMIAEVPNFVPTLKNPSSPITFFPRGSNPNIEVTLNGSVVPGVLIYFDPAQLKEIDFLTSTNLGNCIHFVANEPFLPNSTYQAKYTGTHSGEVIVTKTWTFTTAPG